MEFRSLFNFLQLARSGNFTRAARSLNLSQPALSKQIMELEDELGTPLFIRGKRKTVLTEAGEYLFKNASVIVDLAERTKETIVHAGTEVGGDVSIAGGETRSMNMVAKAIKKTLVLYFRIKFHIFSGNAEAVSERLEKGLADFGVFVLPANVDRFDYVSLPMNDRWGLLLRKDDPLAERESVMASDLPGLRLICSAQGSVINEILGWMGDKAANLDIVATYTLLYNAAILVLEGIGAAICLDGIADISSASGLCFRPFAPVLDVHMAVAWRKGALFSRAASVFQKILHEEIVTYKAAKQG